MVAKLNLPTSLTNNDVNTHLFDLFNDPAWHFNPQFFRLLKPTKNTITKFNDPDNIEQQLTVLTITLTYNHMSNNAISNITDLDLISIIQNELYSFINENHIQLIESNITIERLTDNLLHPETGAMYKTGLLHWTANISQIINHKEAHPINLTPDFRDFIVYIDKLIDNRSRSTTSDTINSIHTCYSLIHDYAHNKLNMNQSIYKKLFNGLHQNKTQVDNNIENQIGDGERLLIDLQTQNMTLNRAYEIINKQFTDYTKAITELNNQQDLIAIKNDLSTILNNIKNHDILCHICDEYLKNEYAQSFGKSDNNLFWNSLSVDAQLTIRQNIQTKDSIMNKLNDQDQTTIQNHIINQFVKFQNYFNVELPQKLNYLQKVATAQIKQFNKIYSTFLSSRQNNELNDLLTDLTDKFANVSSQIQTAIINSITITTDSLPIDHQPCLIDDDSLTVSTKRKTKPKSLPKNTLEQDLTNVKQIRANTTASNPYTISKIIKHFKDKYSDSDYILLSDNLDDFDMLEHASLMSSYADFPYHVHILNSVIKHNNLTTHDLLFTKHNIKYNDSIKYQRSDH